MNHGECITNPIGIDDEEYSAQELKPGILKDIDSAGAARGQSLAAGDVDFDEEPDEPPVEMLLAGMVEKGAFVLLYGPTDVGKSFLAIDLGLTLVQGGKWHGVTVTGGAVAYVAAEAGRSVKKRGRAWRKVHGDERRHRFTVIREPVDFLKERDVDALLARLASFREQPGAVFIDTLAESIPGGEENSFADMSQFVKGCHRIRRQTGAAVFVIAHTGKNGTLRGHSCLPAAADTIIRVTRRNKAVITVHCDRQRELPDFQDMRFTLEPVDDTCVVRFLGTAAVPALHAPVVKVVGNRGKVLEALVSAPAALLRSEVTSETGLPKASVSDALQSLEEMGLIQVVGEKQDRLYSPTADGRQAIGGCSDDCDLRESSVPATELLPPPEPEVAMIASFGKVWSQFGFGSVSEETPSPRGSVVRSSSSSLEEGSRTRTEGRTPGSDADRYSEERCNDCGRTTSRFSEGKRCAECYGKAEAAGLIPSLTDEELDLYYADV